MGLVIEITNSYKGNSSMTKDFPTFILMDAIDADMMFDAKGAHHVDLANPN
jgi:hypothetical protein